MLDWDDLKYFLAVGRHGSTLAAGRALGVDQSTVQRRLVQLERRIGRSLVRKHATGYELTDFGVAILVHAKQVERAITAFSDFAAVSPIDAEGVIRVSCPGPIVNRLAQSDFLASFHCRHPLVRVEFVVSDHYVDLMKGEADVALRSGDTDDGDLVGRKVGDSYWAVYGSKHYVDEHGRPERPEDLEQHALIGLDETMATHRASIWLKRVAPKGRIVAVNNNILGMLYSAKAGLGLAPLPTAIGDGQPDLVRVLGPVAELTRIWRVLTSPEKRHSPHVAAFFDYVVEEVEALRPVLTG
jgi:DNA-binding transcriptional LysR family regulator